MKPWSPLRDRMLSKSRTQTDYYVAVFDRWVSMFCPPVVFPPVPKLELGGDNRVSNVTDAARFAHVSRTLTTDALSRILDCVHSNAGKKHLRNRLEFSQYSDTMLIYIRGKKYPVWDRKKMVRMEEMFLLYALLGKMAAVEEMEAKLEKIRQRTQGAAA